MKSPQLEDGYTRIANELMEQVPRFKLNGTQLRIILVIWRYTYGFKRKSHEFSISFLAEALDTSKSHVDRELTALIDRRVIEVVGYGRSRSRILSFNKNYIEWINERCTTNSGHDPQKVDDKPSGKKETPPQKNKRPTYSEDDQYYKMAAYLHVKIKEMAEDIGFNHASIAKADLQKWANDFRLLVERDGVTDKRLIKEVIDWATADEFWQKNILSAAKLRKQFSRLALEAKGRKRGGTSSRQMDQNERLMREIREEMEHDQDGNQETVLDNKQLLLELPD